MPYKINAQGLPEYVQPDADSMYGVPDYGGNYNSMLGASQQPMSLGQLISMVRQVQQSSLGQPIGNRSQTPTTLGQIPEQVPGAGLVSGARERRTGVWGGPELVYEPVPTIVEPSPDLSTVTPEVSQRVIWDQGYTDTSGGYTPGVTAPKGSGGASSPGVVPPKDKKKKPGIGQTGTSGGSGASGGGTGTHWN